MGKKIREVIISFLPASFFLLFAIVLFRPYFLEGKVPVPGDILIGHYHPWVDKVWKGRAAGYPIKNFILFDGIRQTLPWRLLAIQQIKNGVLPMWNPYILAGMPLLANLQVAAFYPLNFFFFLLPELDAWSIYIFLQPILAGFFTYLFLKTLSCSWRASLLAGIGNGFSLIMMNHLEFGINGHTALWLPLALASINKIQNDPRRRWSLVLILAVSMSLLGGYPPPAIYGLGIVLLYFLLKIRPLLSKKSALVGLAFLVAFGLTAPQILPAFELARKVVRRETQFGVLSNEPYFFPWENLIMVIAPDFFGHPATHNFFSRIYYSDNPSIGVIGLVLVFFSLFWIFKKREVIFFLLLAIFSTLLMLETPLGRSLRHLPIPAFSLVTPMRMIWIVAFSLAVLAGIGIDSVLDLIRKKQFRKVLTPIVVVWELMLLVWIASFLIPEGEHIRVAQRNLVLPTLFLSVSSGLLVLSLFFPKLWPFFATFLILLSGIELVRQGIKYNPFISKELVFPRTEILDKIQKEGKIWRTLITHPELLPVNANTFYQISMIDGYASIYDDRSGQMVGLASTVAPITEIKSYPRIVFQTNYNSPIIDLLNVRWVLSLFDLEDPKLKLVAQEGQTRLYENMKAGPKLFFAKDFYLEKTDFDIVQRMLNTDLTGKVILEKGSNLLLDQKSNLGGKGKVEILEYRPSKVTVKTQKSSFGLLVLTDAYDSGWKVYIDKEPKEILRVDYNLRGVVVPAGSHQVEFVYDPFSFKVGLIIFLLTASGFLGFLFRCLRLRS